MKVVAYLILILSLLFVLGVFFLEPNILTTSILIGWTCLVILAMKEVSDYD